VPPEEGAQDLGLPVKVGGFQDAVTVADIRRLCPSLLLAQNPYDLLFRKTLLLHRPPSDTAGL
jgi:hypothetical protein